MAAETLNWILAVIAFAGVFGNIIAFLAARFQFLEQRQETRDLIKRTKVLEHKVHLLATRLDQRIYRLERVRDLITGLMHVSVALRQEGRAFEDKLNTAVKREMTMPELNALVLAIGDERLQELHVQLAEIIGNPIWSLMWKKDVSVELREADEFIQLQTDCVAKMHLRVLELLDEATSA